MSENTGENTGQQETPQQEAAKETAQSPAPTPAPPPRTQEANPWESMFAGQKPEEVKEALDRSREWERRAKRTVDQVKSEFGYDSAEQAVTAATVDAFRESARIFAGIEQDDADLFLTGSDKDTLSKQAARLAEKFAQPDAPRGGHVPAEGSAPPAPLNSNGLEDAIKNKLGIT